MPLMLFAHFVSLGNARVAFYLSGSRHAAGKHTAGIAGP